MVEAGRNASETQLAEGSLARKSEDASDRRGTQRHPFVALAELVGVGNNQRVAAQTTQLSATGCYLGAVNPYPEGARIRIRLKKDGETFESGARVLHVHAEFGMGVIFEEVPPEQQRILDSWLEKARS